MITKKILFDRAKFKADSAIRLLCSELIKHKVSQQQLADAAYVDKGNLSKILSGVVYPNLKTWTRILAAADLLCHPEWFEEFAEHNDDLPF